MTALVFTLTLLSALAQANSEPQARAVYRISGVVVDAVSNVPVARAEVSISRDNEQTSVVAGNDGRFFFEGLEAGKYALGASATGYLEESYNQHGPFSVAIVTGKDQDTEHLVFRLHPQAVISGRVTDEHGEAVREWRCSLPILCEAVMRNSCGHRPRPTIWASTVLRIFPRTDITWRFKPGPGTPSRRFRSRWDKTIGHREALA